MSADTNLSKTQTSKITQSGGFLDPLMKVAVPLAKNVSATRSDGSSIRNKSRN